MMGRSWLYTGAAHVIGVSLIYTGVSHVMGRSSYTGTAHVMVEVLIIYRYSSYGGGGPCYIQVWLM